MLGSEVQPKTWGPGGIRGLPGDRSSGPPLGQPEQRTPSTSGLPGTAAARPPTQTEGSMWGSLQPQGPTGPSLQFCPEELGAVLEAFFWGGSCPVGGGIRGGFGKGPLSPFFLGWASNLPLPALTTLSLHARGPRKVPLGSTGCGVGGDQASAELSPYTPLKNKILMGLCRKGFCLGCTWPTRIFSCMASPEGPLSIVGCDPRAQNQD